MSTAYNEREQTHTIEFGDEIAKEFCRELHRKLSDEKERRRVEIIAELKSLGVATTNNKELKKHYNLDYEYRQLESLTLALEIIMGNRLDSLINIPNDVDS